MRLDKFLANMGYGSRKEVKGFLKKGIIQVNGQNVKDASMHVDETNDVVTFMGEQVEYTPFIYLMMNKPPGFISATEDLRERTVIDLLTPEEKHFEPFPVGRLDKDTEGFLFLTNDGKLSHELLSPKKHVPKTYFAKVKGIVTEVDIIAFENGVTLDDGYETKPGRLTILKSDDLSEIELIITEGKYHQVKRMFEAVGKEVVYLKRIQMGGLKLDETLALGEYRPLTEDELELIKKKD